MSYAQVLDCLIANVCSSAGCSQKPKGEVTIYVAAPLTGFQANGGQTVLGGAKLAAAKLNQQGGLLGYEVKVVPMDDEWTRTSP